MCIVRVKSTVLIDSNRNMTLYLINIFVDDTSSKSN